MRFLCLLVLQIMGDNGSIHPNKSSTPKFTFSSWTSRRYQFCWKPYAQSFVSALFLCRKYRSNWFNHSVPNPMNREVYIPNCLWKEHIFHLGQPLYLLSHLIFKMCWGVWERAPKNITSCCTDWLRKLFPIRCEACPNPQALLPRAQTPAFIKGTCC